jgi:hypothetical protein
MTPLSRDEYDGVWAIVIAVFIVTAALTGIPFWGIWLGVLLICLPAIWNQPPK